MGIVDEDIGRVREASDIVAVISQYTQLRRVGRRFQGLCPFHSEKSPSFSVNSEEGLYYCFGCGAKGDAITFVREKEHQDFVGAVEWLASKASITLRYTDEGGGEDRKRRVRLQDAVGRAVAWYHDRLVNSEDAGAARSYLRQRGYDGDIVRNFQIGYAPDDWDSLARSLKLSNADLTDSGLGFVNRRNRPQDAFRDRILFPVFDAQGNAVGFGGRVLPEGDGPKYKNSSESAIYAKSRLLYGLNWAKAAIVEADEVVVCEGYTDVIAFAQAGAPTAVATCGTALTEDHVKLLRRFARRVVLAFDADAAGQNAAARVYEWERTHDLDVAIADLPPGVDPGDLGHTDPERLRSSISDASPFLAFRIDRLLDSTDLATAEARARAADQALGMVREHPDPMVRDQYAVSIASRCRLEVALVRRQLDQPGKKSSAQNGQPGRAKANSVRRDTPELEALRIAITEWDNIASLIVPELFTDELCATAYALLSNHDTLHDVIAAGGPEVAEIVQRVSAEDSQAKPADVAALLWQQYLERLMAEIALTMNDASPSEQIDITREHTWLRLRLEEIRDPERQAAGIDELLSWVRDLSEEPV